MRQPAASVMSDSRMARNPSQWIPGLGILRRLWGRPKGRAGLLIVGGLLATVVISPLFLPPGSMDQDLNRAFEGPSSSHWLGTDQAGRDFFARLMSGFGMRWIVALYATLIAMFLGVVSGLIAGYVGSPWEALLLRLVDILLSVPNLVLALVIAALMGAGTEAVIVSLVARGFPAFARVAHAETRSLMAREFVDSGVVLGAGPGRILADYLLPNVLAPSFTLLPILVGGGLLTAASLSFFGLGIQPPSAELGLLVSEGRGYINLLPILLWAPGLLMALNNVGLSLLSAGLRVALDPTQRDREG